jgi:hypothetical protein
MQHKCGLEHQLRFAEALTFDAAIDAYIFGHPVSRMCFKTLIDHTCK